MRNYVKIYIYSCPLHILTPNQFFDIPFIPVLRLIPTILPSFSNFSQGAGVGKVVVVEGGWLVGQGGLGQGWAVVWLQVTQSIPGLFPTVWIQLGVVLDLTLQQGQLGLQFELRVWLGLLETGLVQQGSWGGGGWVL